MFGVAGGLSNPAISSAPHLGQLVDYPGEAARIMDSLWQAAAARGAARRRVFDIRLALTLRHHGVTRFATVNTKHFQGLGFDEVYDPLA